VEREQDARERHEHQRRGGPMVAGWIFPCALPNVITMKTTSRPSKRTSLKASMKP